jgi:1,4-dihydroxy-2-naphthoate octaprenyltransferase
LIKRFLSYVEITTKITSIFAFFMTLGYLFYIKQSLHWKATLVFFVAMFLLDLATTAINNYIDTKTNTQILQFSRKIALSIIAFLLAISACLGLYLVYLTDVVILLLGVICFGVGIFYTFGPIPISRLPFGEIFSGVFYGFFIPLIILYINMPPGTYLYLGLSLDTITLELSVIPFITLILLSVAPVCTTANIMLANNICDLEKDIPVKRYTLPYYLRHKSLYLFAGLYYCTYLATVVMVIFKIISPISLISLLTIPLVQKNINIFFKEQDKQRTFIVAIKNYLLIMGSNTLLLFVSGLIK